MEEARRYIAGFAAGGSMVRGCETEAVAMRCRGLPRGTAPTRCGWTVVVVLVAAVGLRLCGTAATYVEDFGSERPWFATYWNADGFIEITQDQENRTRFARCPEPAGAGLYEVDVAIVTDTGDRTGGRITGLAGIEFRSSESDEEKWSYAILLDQDGRYAFFTLSPSRDTWTYLRGGETRAIRTGLGKINRIEVEFGERNTYVRFNDGERIGVNAMIPRDGSVCCTVFNLEGTTAARFDNLRFGDVSSSPMGD
jgi:hypothetical protein